MSVGQVERNAGRVVRWSACGENNSLVVTERRKKGFQPLLSFHNIMVAVKQIQPVFLIKLAKKPENVAVDIHDVFDASVFPQLVAVSQLDIGKSLPVIVL